MTGMVVLYILPWLEAVYDEPYFSDGNADAGAHPMSNDIS
jgi:hypothetical protein